ncbi:Ldh family oxidoreductase [Zavarzinella formosa]|uniref:Ldh family oxidoreductase n=1 Tax=Zavarzinella formosa TaxID=360055 RepID=UPI0002F73FE1|nr:Ldh family oxidoreductase [Zavarzinella formosa]
MSQSNERRVAVNDLMDFCRRALATTGMSIDDAYTTADALVATDTMGVFTHGTKLLAGYLNRLRGGGYDPKGRPKIEREGPSWAVIDGETALGQVGSVFAMQTAIDKASKTGVAYVGLRNTGHIGAAGYHAWLAAQKGMIGMVVGNDIPSVAAPGSRGPVLGSNPLAYAVPVEDGDPILLDVATAAVAGGKVYAAHQRGETIPPTWLIGPDGHPTTDGSLYPKQASLAPMAGHKGYGLGLWCEILSAVLPGGAMTWQVGSWMFDPADQPSKHNAGFLAIDVATIAPPTDFTARIRSLINEIHASPKADGVDHLLMPGEREWSNRRQAMTKGIPLPADVIEKLRLAAEMTGYHPDWLAN